MYKTPLAVLKAATSIAMLILASAPPAMAGGRHRAVNVQRANGQGYARARSIERQPGSMVASRNIQFRNGRGSASARGATWSDGSYAGMASHVRNDGTTFGRSTSATRNDDGSISYMMSRTGPRGQSRQVSGSTASRP